VLRQPVAVLAAAYAAGICIQRYFFVSQSLLYAIALCALIVACVCLVVRYGACAIGAVVLLAASLGALAYAPFHSLPESARQLQGWLNRPVAVEGVVRQVEFRPSGALRLTLSYDSIETPEKQQLCRGLLLVTLKQTSREYCYGQRLRFNCRLRRPHNFNNPGGFDYERFLAHRNVYVTAFLNDDRTVLLLREGCGNPLVAALERYRSKLRQFVRGQLADPERAMVLALLLGEKQTLDPQIRQQFARLGLAHLLAISGLHIAIVAGLVFALACFALRRMPRLLLFVVLWKAAALVSIVPVLLYCCVAGLRIPTLRAGIMIFVCIVALLIDRRTNIFNALALACFIILIWWPASLFEISFQLSFSAVFFLIVCAPRVQKMFAAIELTAMSRSRRALHGLYRFLGGILAASFIATAATAPITAFYFQQMPIGGVFANCLLVPAIGFVAVPCSLLAAVAFPLSETVAAGLLHAAALMLEQALLWIRFWSNAPLVSVSVLPPSAGAMIVYCILLLYLLFCDRKRRIVPVFFLCCVVVVLWIRQPQDSAGLLRITFLDVGHGDATIVQFPRGGTMLIDAGGLRSERFNTGELIVAPALRALGIRQVSWLVISHPHHDHMAGIPFIANNFQPMELWLPTESYPDPFLQKLVFSARLQGLRLRSPARGAAPITIDGVSVEILSPEPGQAAAARTYHALNDSSLVMKISYGAHAFLLTGDIGMHQEQKLLKSPIALKANVLKVPHHGKRASSTSAFLDAVAPDSAIFSCRPYAGRDIPAGVFSRYRDRGVHVFRTDRQGAIQITSNGTRLETYTFMPHREFTFCTAP